MLGSFSYLFHVKPGKKNSASGKSQKQLDVITEYLRKTAEEEGIKIRPLWLEPIPAIIMIEELKKKYAVVSEKCRLNPVIGEYDDPARQRQCILRLPISDEGNVVVYGVAGSGKTTFLNAMIYSLIHEHTPDEVNLYILDFASETLRAFAKAPHVGDVILAYEAEKIGNLFKIRIDGKSSVVFYFSKNIKFERLYNNKVIGTSFRVGKDSDIIITGLGFIKTTEDITITVPSDIVKYINVRPSITGGKNLK